MSNELVCPFCQKELLLSSYRDDDTAHQMWNCLSCQLSAQRKIWQELIKLMDENKRTRKALDVAVDALKRLEKELYFNNAKQTGHIADSVISIPSIALEQITALEQKD